MSHYRRANTAGGTYFFTVVTYRRQAFLCDEDVRGAMRTAINRVRKGHPFQIDAWVLLPDLCIAYGRCRRTTPIFPCAGI